MLVSDDTVVISMTTVFAFQGFHQLFHRKISGFAQPLFQTPQSTTETVSCSLTPDLRSAFGVFPPAICEAEKIERFAADKESVKAKTAGFLRGQRKLELSKSPFQRLLELSGIIMILKSTDKVINIADYFCTTTAIWLDLMLEPEIKDIMQVDVGQNRRDDTALCEESYYAKLAAERLTNSEIICRLLCIIFQNDSQSKVLNLSSWRNSHAH